MRSIILEIAKCVACICLGVLGCLAYQFFTDDSVGHNHNQTVKLMQLAAVVFIGACTIGVQLVTQGIFSENKKRDDDKSTHDKLDSWLKAFEWMKEAIPGEAISEAELELEVFRGEMGVLYKVGGWAKGSQSLIRLKSAVEAINDELSTLTSLLSNAEIINNNIFGVGAPPKIDSDIDKIFKVYERINPMFDDFNDFAGGFVREIPETNRAGMDVRYFEFLGYISDARKARAAVNKKIKEYYYSYNPNPTKQPHPKPP